MKTAEEVYKISDKNHDIAVNIKKECMLKDIEKAILQAANDGDFETMYNFQFFEDFINLGIEIRNILVFDYGYKVKMIAPHALHIFWKK